MWIQVCKSTYHDRGPLFTDTQEEQGFGDDFASAGGGAPVEWCRGWAVWGFQVCYDLKGKEQPSLPKEEASC